MGYSKLPSFSNKSKENQRLPKALLPAAALRIVGVTLIFAVIWLPWLAYNHVPELTIGSGMIEQGRSIPDDALLNELGKYDLGKTFHWVDDRELIGAAEKILLGTVELPGFPITNIKAPFKAAAMASGPTMWQLFVHSLGVPNVLMAAYRTSGRSEFLRAAADYLVAYDAYESTTWKPGGFLWNDTWSRFVRNDHAVAARVPVLSEFWRLYRKSPDYQPDVAEAVFRMAARCAYLLADPSRFTVATNHGIMQNLALCNVGLSFPTLPNTKGYCKLAFMRLDKQLAFFINDEGFVLEHSPGYQRFALRLLGIAFRYLSLLDQDVPVQWMRKYEAAQRVYAVIRRPDGSIPVFGDTDGKIDRKGPVITATADNQRHARLSERAWSPDRALFFAPIAGYCLWWNRLGAWPDPRQLSQTAIAWSNFDGMGHKHADELSLTVWAAGTSWWTNVGYWPYDILGRDMAESWVGANAPHFVGEPAQSLRKTRVRNYGWDGDLKMIDLERNGPGSYRARRQIINLGPGTWIVIDTSSGVHEGRSQTIWTTSPTVNLKEDGVTESYTLTDASTGQSLQAFFEGIPSITRQVINGSLSPFGGWSVVDGMVRSAPSVVIEQPADSLWMLAAWSLMHGFSSEFELTEAPQMRRWAGEEEWKIALPTTNGPATIERRGIRIDLSTGSGRLSSLELSAGPDVSRERAELRAALATASKNFGAVDMSGVYRLKVTVVLLAALVVGATILRVMRRFNPAWTPILRLIITTGWLLLSVYLIFLRAQLV